jgi:Protein of unknown function (DUF3341)
MHAGMLAEFRTSEELLRAVRELRARGFRRLDAFTPYPVKGLEQALGLTRSPLNWLVFPLAMGGAGLAYLIQWWCNAIDYPINVGGRPLHSALAFIPIVFETGVLTASFAGFFIFLALSHLPELYSPVSDVEGFERASTVSFWVGVDERDPAFNTVELERTFMDLGALHVGRAEPRRRR